MNTDAATIRLLGAAILFVFLASLISEQLLTSAVGSGGISEILVNVTANLPRVRLSNLVALLNSLASSSWPACFTTYSAISTGSSR